METVAVDPALTAALVEALAQDGGMSWSELLSIALPTVVGIVASITYAVRATCAHLNSIALRIDETLRHLADGTITVRIELVHRDEVQITPPARTTATAPHARA